MPERWSLSQPFPLRIILDSTLRTLDSGRGVALLCLELVPVVFVAAGIGAALLGASAPWFVAVAILLGVLLRAVDMESCALLLPGGLYGASKGAFGPRGRAVVAAALFIEQLCFGGLVASAAGHYAASLVGLTPGVSLSDLSSVFAAAILGVCWWTQRQGWQPPAELTSRVVVTALSIVSIVAVWALASVVSRPSPPPLVVPDVAALLRNPLTLFAGIGSVLFIAGSVEALGRVAPEFPAPRLREASRATRRVWLLTSALALTLTYVFTVALPEADAFAWRDASVSALAYFAAGPSWLRVVGALAAGLAAIAFLALAAQRSTLASQHLLSRLVSDGALSEALHQRHSRLGTFAYLTDITVGAQLLIVMAGGQLVWMAKALGVMIAVTTAMKVATLVRLRAIDRLAGFRVPLRIRLGTHEFPAGLFVIALLAALSATALILQFDPGALAALLLTAAVTALIVVTQRSSATNDEAVELAYAASLSAADVAVRPGSVVVAIRRPYAVAHLAEALRTKGDRDIVVMTVRLVDVEVAPDVALQPPTEEERRLMSAAVAVAEEHARAIRLLIVPATDVGDAIADTVVRLQASAIYVGESETLSVDDQARLLGEAWERADKPGGLDVRLIVRHSSGRTATYQLGAHAPRLSSADLQLIHAMWLDMSKTIGPHVHHHDVVRAALRHMSDQLHDPGPSRQAAVDLVREVARPSDELASAVHQRDFGRLRDQVRNRPASDLAALFDGLSIQDQVIAFRVLPRDTAAATFEYLSREAQEQLLKAMATEDVAGLLNSMAPDDRTMFLEELPASATQQLLALLSPEERRVAVTLLGYPEGSIGRLMTPDYIAVREQWTVQEVLDYIRTHGRDSETLNVVYVVDERGTLIDDIRIRELLLASTTSRMSDLLDRRFIALSAADAQDVAVAVFRREDRSALPVTDSAGVLIGIVTIDDVLDVAEATATKEIQRIGGSEAFDEPYMRISFFRMIRKRAGWLTALFLGEMLTATAMAAFEQEIQRAVVLALFVPLIISSGGNSGSQASTLVIRAIALGEVALGDWWRVMRREILAGLTLGGILGTIGFLRISIWSTFSDIYGAHWLLLALTVAIALVGVVLWGTLVGSLLPFLLRRLGFDPATSSAPFVATLVDVTGLIIYFSVGLVILRGTLL